VTANQDRRIAGDRSGGLATAVRSEAFALGPLARQQPNERHASDQNDTEGRDLDFGTEAAGRAQTKRRQQKPLPPPWARYVQAGRPECAGR